MAWANLVRLILYIFRTNYTYFRDDEKRVTRKSRVVLRLSYESQTSLLRYWAYLINPWNLKIG